MPEPGGGSVPGLAVFAAGLAALLAISGTALVGRRRQRQR